MITRRYSFPLSLLLQEKDRKREKLYLNIEVRLELYIFTLFVSRWGRNGSLYRMESSYGLSNSEIQPPESDRHTPRLLPLSP